MEVEDEQADQSLREATALATTTADKGGAVVQRNPLELFDTAFKDHHYPYPVVRETVLDYFSRSPFYDKRCNNEVIREQNKPLEALKYMTGLEYVAVRNKHEPRLFIIVKQERSSEYDAKKLAVYYVLDQTVYQAPNVQQVCLRRIRGASEQLAEAMDFFTQYRAFSCVDGRTWTFPSDQSGLWRDSVEWARFRNRTERKSARKTRRVLAAIGETAQLLKKRREEKEKGESSS